MRGLDSEPRSDPNPELLEALGRVADELAECRRATQYSSDKATRQVVEKARGTFRDLIAKVG